MLNLNSELFRGERRYYENLLYKNARKNSPEEILMASLSVLMSWTARESQMWAEWHCEYKNLQSNSDSRIVTLWERGVQVLLGRECQAIERERNEKIYGYE